MWFVFSSIPNMKACVRIQLLNSCSTLSCNCLITHFIWICNWYNANNYIIFFYFNVLLLTRKFSPHLTNSLLTQQFKLILRKQAYVLMNNSPETRPEHFYDEIKHTFSWNIKRIRSFEWSTWNFNIEKFEFRSNVLTSMWTKWHHSVLFFPQFACP